MEDFADWVDEDHSLTVSTWFGEPSDSLCLVHAEDCGTTTDVVPLPDGGYGAATVYACLPAQLVEYYGLEFFFAHRDDPEAHQDATRLPPGTYKVRAWSEYDNRYGEADVGMEVIDSGGADE